MGITRFNVYAGLAGLYIIRDAEEAALCLPAGPYEIPLLLQDRNLETAPDGSLTGRLLHKIEDGTMEFFGPFTLVNGTIWPHLPVEARQYRPMAACSGSRLTFPGMDSFLHQRSVRISSSTFARCLGSD